MPNTRRLFLTGFSGSGKSAVASLVAAEENDRGVTKLTQYPCANCNRPLKSIDQVCKACEGGLLDPPERDSTELAWREFAREVGGQLIYRSALLGSKRYLLEVRLDKWRAVFSAERVSTGPYSSKFVTRVAAAFIERDGFHFEIRPRRSLPGGFKDSPQPRFDSDFTVRANNEDSARHFLTERLQALMQMLAGVTRFYNDRSVTLFRRRPRQHPEVVFEADGLITDPQTLRTIRDLFDEALTGLVRIGTAEDLAPAMVDAEAAIESDPDHPEGYFSRGIAYLDQGDLDSAIRDFDQAIRLDPEDPEAYYNRGFAYAHLGDTRRAFTDFDRAVELDPCYPEAYVERGRLLATLGRVAEALEDLEQARELTDDPGLMGDLYDLIAELSHA